MADIPADLGAALDPNLPVALLPIRLETRFGTRDHFTDDGRTLQIPVLRIRMYPDDISVVTSTPGLNARETEAGREFWEIHDAPPTDAEQADPGALAHRRSAAWELLVRHVGRERAASVARGTRLVADGDVPDLAAPAGAAADAPATARLLPDSWVVTGWSDGVRVLSAHVPGVAETVQVGPTRQAGADAFDPSDPHLLAADDGMRWVTDFEEAERRAMAVTVDLSSPDQVDMGLIPSVVSRGVDTLVVFGVREPTAARTAATEAAAFADLVSAHAASDRVGFVAQGTATNNVDGRPSGWPSAPHIYAPYARVAGAVDAVDGAVVVAMLDTGVDALRGGADNATTTAAALGLPQPVFADLDGAAALEQWPARAMARALFPVTVGEVLGTLARPTKAAAEDYEHLLDRLDDLIPFASEHMASFVRSRGPLPALRVGRQPYGMLPVVAPDRWALRAGEPGELPNLVAVLGVLRPFWEHAAATVGRLTGASLDLTHATEQLVRILGLGPVPHPGAYQVRDVAGAVGSLVYCPERQPFLVQDVEPDAVFLSDRMSDAVSDAVRLVGYRVLLAMTLPGLVRGSQLEAMQLHGIQPLSVHVARSDPNREGWTTVPDYLHRLTESFDLRRLQVLLDPGDEHKPTDLLFVLAEHAMALSGELDSLLFLHRVSRDAAVTVVAMSPELLTSGLSVATEAAAMFTSPLSDVRAAAEPAGEFAWTNAELAGSSLFDVIADDDLVRHARDEFEIPTTHLEGFPGTRAAIDALADAGLSDAEYTRLVGEALSCCTNRLDAWYTSLAAQRLAALRADQPSGLQLGCWGLLVDVRPSTTATAAVPDGWDPALDDGRSGAAVSRGPLLAPRRQIGYVHAPSLAHARTAGMLRAGELAYEGDDTTLTSLDLTSRRARIARDIVAAVANGQPLGAVLGYRLERSLGDAGLHGAVTTLRAAFPQRRSAEDADAHVAAGLPASDSVAPPEVVDGLDVWRAGAAAQAMCAVDDGPDTDRLAAALADLDVAVEAVADTLVAEGLHQLSSGRADAAGATFAAIASGGHVDSELDVLREPRQGTAITNRLVLLLDEQGGVDGWNRDRPRAALAPEVERWAETVLGPPSRWRASVANRTLSLADLSLCALDVIVETATTGAQQRPLLEQRLAVAAGVVTTDFTVTEPAGDGPRWAELLALTGAVRDVLAAARPVVPADLDPGPQETRPDAGVVRSPAGPTLTALDPLAHRVADALDALAAGVGAVSAATAATPVAPLLEPFVALGLPGSVVVAPVLEDARVAAAAATAILTDADRVIDGTVAELARAAIVEQPAGTRLAKLRAVCRAPRALDTLVELTRRVAGSAVVAVPEARSALAAHLLADDDRAPSTAEVEEWLGRVARVRTNTANYDDLRLFVEAGGGDPDAVTVAQLPLVDGEAWLGGPLTTDDAPRNALRAWCRPSGPRSHLVLAGAAALAGGGTVRALVLDEYVEVLPAPTTTTGLALHYDAPNARPPQSVLLALHPDPSYPWDWELVEATVLETLALAALRLVELDDLAPTAVDEYLPFTYLRDGVGETTPVAELTKNFAWSEILVSATRVSEVFQR